MELLSLVYRQYRWPFIAIVLLSLLSAVSGIGVIAFINQSLIESSGDPLPILGQLLGLIVLLLVVTLGAQLALTTLGHHFVYQLRGRLLKQLLDTDVARIRQIGQGPLLASLSSDIGQITIAFVRLPELVQGLVLTLGSVIYLGWLSPSLLTVTALWVTVTMVVGWLLVIIAGSKELALNRERAHFVYHQLYEQNARDYRQEIIRADTYHLSAVNWSNIMMLGAIGLVFFLANGLGWANTNVAATFALTLLFLRTPLLQGIGALPTLIAAQVAFDKIAALTLAEPRSEFPLPPAPRAWRRIELEQVSFHYPGEGGFAVGPVNLAIEKGEQIFIIGGNGSGKSTLAMLLTGLYQPVSGRILLDGEPIADRNAYLALFSAIFTDYHLFQHLLGPEPKDALIAEWLERLQMGSKLRIEDDFITDIDLSQGQRKRVALLLALAEQREVMLFDEWAADQDPQFRRIFYQVLLPRLKEMGKTVIAISHDDLYFSQADRLLEMRQGRLTELLGERREQVSRDAVAHLDSEVPA